MEAGGSLVSSVARDDGVVLIIGGHDADLYLARNQRSWTDGK